MLKTYNKVEHSLPDIHRILVILVKDVFCQADTQRVATKIKVNDTLAALYTNHDSTWFKDLIDKIYKVCKTLTSEERQQFFNVFTNNNQIEYLCSHPNELLAVSSLNTPLVEVITPLFKELYSKILNWKVIKDNFGTKEDYYNKLIQNNNLNACPCCGYGSVRDIYNSGHSAFDHYFPVKHYPFSVINFDNLFPLCHECNSTEKGEKNILLGGKKIFFPANQIHPNIEVQISININKFITIFFKKIDFTPESLTMNIVYPQEYQEQIESWDEIFGIKQRYFGQTATNAISWFNHVRDKYRRNQEKGRPDTFENAFDEVIEDDSNKHLGFLKAPFLENLKNNSFLLEAFKEVQGSSIIDSGRPVL